MKNPGPKPAMFALILSAVLRLLPGVPDAAQAQFLINVDFGAGQTSGKQGFAATGYSTNDFWNRHTHDEAQVSPGKPLPPNATTRNLKLANGATTTDSITVENAPGTWGNATGDAMYDSFIYARNGSNIVVRHTDLAPGHYSVFLYGHADPDGSPEQNSVFTLKSGTNTFGPLGTTPSAGWKATMPWVEGRQYVVFRDVQVRDGRLTIEVAPGAGGVAVLNGLQLISRGTSPPRTLVSHAAQPEATYTNLIIHAAEFDGTLTKEEARFTATLKVESLTTNEVSAVVFGGEIAVFPKQLPSGLRLSRSVPAYSGKGSRTKETGSYVLHCSTPGSYEVELEVVAKVTRAEPWNQTAFTGPPAAAAELRVQAGAGMQIEMLKGAAAQPTTADKRSGKSVLSGVVGADRQIALRWQGRTTEVVRKSLITVDTQAKVQISPTVIKYEAQFRYELLQASAERLRLSIPKGQTLTRVQGEQIRDWQVATAVQGDPELAIEFARPVEKNYQLTLFTEQTVEGTPANAGLQIPTPLEVTRESGSLTVTTDETLVDLEPSANLRQINAGKDALAAYRFNLRPVSLAAAIRRIEPRVEIADHLRVSLEETRLVLTHALNVGVDKAGIYSLELTPQPGFVVSSVAGNGMDDWKLAAGKLKVDYAAKVLGKRTLTVVLEQALKQFTNRFQIQPLRVAGAEKEIARIGAVAAPGILLKSDALTNLREIPVSQLSNPSNEVLAFAADKPDWSLTLTAEQLPGRVIAEVFNLITIGDGLIGGSATIRYGLVDQGVQQFKVRLPAHWKNVEFTGPNIRRKELVNTGAPASAPRPVPYATWLISLQDKAWGGYTLVVTYDHQFNPRGAKLDLAGLHCLDAEREAGSVAVTAASGLKVTPNAITAPLRAIDQTELGEADRALINRPVLFAWRYTGDDFALTAGVNRYEQERVLDAVADHTKLLTTITEAGEMLTQASFMVKNNDRQFQRFKLPKHAEFWGCYVNNQPAKAEKDGDWLLASLPRGDNRDQTFAVDIVYAQKMDALKGRWFPASLDLKAPETDVPNTYAEWEVWLPANQEVSRFGGNMTVLQGTTYSFRDGWDRFTKLYAELWERSRGTILVISIITLVVSLIVFQYRRNHARGLINILVAVMLLAVMAGMFLPALGKAKAKSSRIKSVSQLKQIGLAAKVFANDNGDRFPFSFEEMRNEIGNTNILIDPQSGLPYIYVGGGKDESVPNAIIAYSPVDIGGRNVAFADGSVGQLTSEEFAKALQRDAEATQEIAVRQAQNRASVTGPNRQLQPRDFERARGRQAAAANAPAQPMAPTPLMAPPPVVAATVAPTAVGLRSIRIDIPRSGQAISFTKVLNLAQEPLSVSMSLVSEKAHGFFLWAGQLILFLGGLVFAFIHWCRHPRSSLMITLGIAVAIYAVLWKAVSARTLHWLFILGFPSLTLLFFAWIASLCWPKRREVVSSQFSVPSAQSSVVNPAEPPATNEQPPTTPAISPAAEFDTASAPEPTTAPTLETRDESKPEPESKSKTKSARKRRGGGGGAALLVAGLGMLWGSQAFAAGTKALVPAPDNSGEITLSAATYEGVVHEKAAEFEAELQLSCTGTNLTFTLFHADVAVQSFEFVASSKAGKSKRADAAASPKLVREGSQIKVWAARPGTFALRMRLLVPLSGDAAKRQLNFALPPALASEFEVSVPEKDAAVEFPSAVAFTRSAKGTNTIVKAVIGATDRVDLLWTPKLKKLAEMEATVFAQNTTAVTVGGGVVNVRSLIEYQILQGEIDQAKLRLPGGQRLLRVDGQSIRTWEVFKQGGSELLTVDLIKGATKSYELTIETEKPLGDLPADVPVEVTHVEDVRRETGLVGLNSTEEIALSPAKNEGLQRVDAAEFAKAAGKKLPGAATAYRYFKPGFELAVRAETVQPQLEAVSRNHLSVHFNALSLRAGVDYEVKKAGVFRLQVEAPAGWNVDSVNVAPARLSPSDVRSQGVVLNARGYTPTWTEKVVNGKRLLDIQLAERTIGKVSLQLALSQVVQQPPASQIVPAVHPLGLEKHRGYVTVVGGAGISLKTGAFSNLTEVPPQTVPTTASIPNYYTPGGNAVLAFQFIDTTPATPGDWSLTVDVEQLESWVRAEVANLVSVTETLLTGRAIVRLDIANAPLKEFRLKIPATVTNVEIAGTNIRRRDQTGEVWRVELQTALRGMQTFTVAWEQPRDPRATGPLAVPVVNAVGVERETGFVALLAKPPLQVTEQSASEALARIDSRELPTWTAVSTAGTIGAESVLLAHRYLRPDYTLTINAKRFDEAGVLQALVDDAKLTTVVADDGQTMTQVKLQVRNNGKQFIELALPEGARVWSAFVSGQPVRPSKHENKIMLPLEQAAGDNAPQEIEFTYVDAGRFPRTSGRVALNSPALDLPFKNAEWTLYLPPDYEFTKFGGSMKREEDAGKTVIRKYDYESYSRVERDNQRRDARQLESAVSNIRSQLTSGNLKDANGLLFQNSFNPSAVFRQAQDELAEVKKEVVKAQARNFVQSQRAYAIENNDRYSQGGQQGGQQTLQMPNQQAEFNAPAQMKQLAQVDATINRFEEQAAEQQVLKLQLAQEVETVTVQPLRVNLPARGQKHTFTQVLQTEVNKPMTVAFDARNLKREGWGKWVLLSLGGFLLLWVAVGLCSLRREEA